MDEIWKPIPDTDYAVSNTGKVASMKKGWRVLRPKQSRGYMYVCLCDGSGGERTRLVHRLVAEAFLGPKPTPKHQVNHIDGARTNLRADNLEWCTQSENQRHRFDVLKHGNPHGEKVGTAKLTEVDARDILRRCAAGETQREVAADYGITPQNVWLIATGKSWAWLAHRKTDEKPASTRIVYK